MPKTQTNAEGNTFVDLTPQWVDILPTWLMMYRQAITGDCSDPSLIRHNAEVEFRHMAEAADNFNALVAWMRESEGYSDDIISNAVKLGKALRG